MASRSTVLLHPRRIGIAGTVADELEGVAEPFCRAVGAALARREAVVVTRGGPSTQTRNHRFPVDEWVARGAAAVVSERGASAEDWIETLLSDATREGTVEIGTIHQVRARTYEAARFAMVDRVDGVIAIGGGAGTRQSLVLALATERPTLPVPLFGGAAARNWDEHRSELATAMRLEPAMLVRWASAPASAAAAEVLATEMVDRFLDSLARRCFVAMPFQGSHEALFDFVIGPAVRGLGDTPVRLDRLEVPGDVGQQIHEAIHRSDYVIAVLDDLRPNVLYELGLAHGANKSTILLNQRSALGNDEVPFDLTMQQRLEYEQVDGSLPSRLQAAIRALGRL